MRARTWGVGGAVALLTVVAASPVVADTTEPPWSDGTYHLALEVRGSGSGSADDTSASGAINGGGSVEFTLVDGTTAEPTPFMLTYVVGPIDIEQSGQSGSAMVEWIFDGTVEADGGHVQLDPDTLSITLMDATFGGIDVGDVPLGVNPMAADIRFPLNASAPVCGIAAGHFEGTLDWLLTTARQIPGGANALGSDTFLDSSFTAVTPDLSEDPTGFVDEVTRIQLALTLTAADISLADGAVEDLLFQALDLVADAEANGSAARPPECPSFDFYGLGIDGHIQRVIDAALARGDLTAQELWLLAQLASRSGLSHSSDTVLNLRQQVLEAGLAPEAIGVELLLMAAAAIGDWDVVEALTDVLSGSVTS